MDIYNELDYKISPRVAYDPGIQNKIDYQKNEEQYSSSIWSWCAEINHIISASILLKLGSWDPMLKKKYMYDMGTTEIGTNIVSGVNHNSDTSLGSCDIFGRERLFVHLNRIEFSVFGCNNKRAVLICR